MTSIDELNFYKFLIGIGDIFTKLYFENDIIMNATKEYEHKNITNYECILRLLCLGKNNDCKNMFFGNFDEFYSLGYMQTLTNNLIFAININYRLSSSNENYENILNYFINELFFQIYDKEDEQFTEIERFIKNSINNYWCNSIFFMDEDFEDFLCIFYEFITEKNTKKFINCINKPNEYDDFYKKYLECFSNEASILFENFDKNSLIKFEKSLYDFIHKYKKKFANNYRLELLLKIEKNNQQLSQEDIGLISMIILNNKFMSDIKDEIEQGNNINSISQSFELNNYEICVLTEFFKDKYIENQNIIYNGNEIIDSLSEEAKNDSNCKIYEGNESNENSKNDCIIANNIKEKENIQENSFQNHNSPDNSITDDNLNKVQGLAISNENNKEILNQNKNNVQDNMIVEDNKENIKCKLNSPDNQIVEKKFKENEVNNNIQIDNNVISKDDETDKLINDVIKQKNYEENKIDGLLEIINQLNSKIVAFEKYKHDNEEYKKKNEQYKHEYDKVKKDFMDEQKLNQLKFEKMEEELKNQKKEIEKLKNIHKSIYFRDVSKLYIREFTKMTKNIDDINMYKTCQKILKFNFDSNKLRGLKSIMIKIVNHYLKGNKNAHIEYFIKENNDSNENLLENIRLKYVTFMKFNLQQQIILKDSFNFNAANYLLKNN